MKGKKIQPRRTIKQKQKQTQIVKVVVNQPQVKQSRKRKASEPMLSGNQNLLLKMAMFSRVPQAPVNIVMNKERDDLKEYVSQLNKNYFDQANLLMRERALERKRLEPDQMDTFKEQINQEKQVLETQRNKAQSLVELQRKELNKLRELQDKASENKTRKRLTDTLEETIYEQEPKPKSNRGRKPETEEDKLRKAQEQREFMDKIKAQMEEDKKEAMRKKMEKVRAGKYKTRTEQPPPERPLTRSKSAPRSSFKK